MGHHQSIDATNVGELAQTPFVWQRTDGSYAVVQTWKVAINEQFQKTFTITSENPNEGKFGVQAAEEFKMALAGLFGDDIVKELGIKYCHKVTHNAKPALVGSSEKLIEFIKSWTFLKSEKMHMAVNLFPLYAAALTARATYSPSLSQRLQTPCMWST